MRFDDFDDDADEFNMSGDFNVNDKLRHKVEFS